MLQKAGASLFSVVRGRSSVPTILTSKVTQATKKTSGSQTSKFSTYQRAAKTFFPQPAHKLHFKLPSARSSPQTSFNRFERRFIHTPSPQTQEEPLRKATMTLTKDVPQEIKSGQLDVAKARSIYLDMQATTPIDPRYKIYHYINSSSLYLL
jgi:hypothetical protein